MNDEEREALRYLVQGLVWFTIAVLLFCVAFRGMSTS